MSEKKTFFAEKIRTSEICGIDGELVISSEIAAQAIAQLSGKLITGEYLSISGHQVYVSGDQVSISGHQTTITDGGGDGQ